MPSLAEHIAADIFRFGVSFEDVHRELDATFADGSYAHRRNTHYFEFVLARIASKHWSIEQGAAAVMHIIDDCKVLMLASDWATGEDLISYARDKKDTQEE